MKQMILAALLAPAFANVFAEVVVSDAWVRATVSQQKDTGAFMQLTSTETTRLVSIRSSVADTAELHEMSFDNNVMRMRQMPGLDLPARAAVYLKPGGYHIMLFRLHKPLSTGQLVPITLVFESSNKQRSSMVVDAIVRPLALPVASVKP